MRSTGRVKRLSEITNNVKHPIILNSRHRLVHLLLQHLHDFHHHPGVDFMRAQVQQHYAVLKLRNTPRKIESCCLVCRRLNAEMISPMMADLPNELHSFQKPPFTMTGVGYFCPLFVTVCRSSKKRWGFLHTCLNTRAVHLEVVPSRDTNLCVMGIVRFATRRGTPSVIWSDNGTKFVGSKIELFENIWKWNEQAPEHLVHKKTTWKFNPPGTCHQGGSWERLVRNCKRVFYAIFSDRRLTDEILLTVFCLVEQTLNARPSTTLSSDPNDTDALTLNNFLFGRLNTGFPPTTTSAIAFNHRKRYERAHADADAIWTRWLKEYIR